MHAHLQSAFCMKVCCRRHINALPVYRPTYFIDLFITRNECSHYCQPINMKTQACTVCSLKRRHNFAEHQTVAARTTCDGRFLLYEGQRKHRESSPTYLGLGDNVLCRSGRGTSSVPDVPLSSDIREEVQSEPQLPCCSDDTSNLRRSTFATRPSVCSLVPAADRRRRRWPAARSGLYPDAASMSS